MIYFDTDYMAGAHPKVMERLLQTNSTVIDGVLDRHEEFFRLPNDIIDRLKENISFEMWGPRGETESVVRFVTGWTTTDDEINQLISYIDIA